MRALTALLLGLAVGTTVAVQSTFNAVLYRAVGLWPATFVVHFVGLVTVLLPLIALRGSWRLGDWRQAPWYVWLGGAMGAVIIAGITYLVAQVGVTAGLSVIIAGQLVAAVVIDRLGMFGAPVRPFDFPRLAGLVLLFVAVRLVLR